MGKPMLSKDQLGHLRQLLLAEQERLQRDTGNLDPNQLATEDNNSVGNHLAETASDMFEQENLASLQLAREQRLAQVNHALERMEDGTYGKCERCGRDIGYERLEAMPYTTLCVEDQALVESGQAG
jgi:RNA polymerase-binding protein DksA